MDLVFFLMIPIFLAVFFQMRKDEITMLTHNLKVYAWGCFILSDKEAIYDTYMTTAKKLSLGLLGAGITF